MDVQVVLAWQAVQPASKPCPRCGSTEHCSQCCPTLREKRERSKVRRKRRTKEWHLSEPLPLDLPLDGRAWYERMYRLVRYTISKKVRNLPESLQEEALSNGLCFSVGIWDRLYPRLKDKAPVDVARIVGYLAARSALAGKQFVSTREHGYVDCLDPRLSRGSNGSKRVPLDEYFPAPLQVAYGEPRDTQDMGSVSTLIGSLPERYRGVAFCLAANDDMRALVRRVIGSERRTGELTNTEIAAYCGCSRPMVNKLIGELQDEDNDTLTEWRSDLLDACYRGE